jgi:hypothetical protein
VLREDPTDGSTVPAFINVYLKGRYVRCVLRCAPLPDKTVPIFGRTARGDALVSTPPPPPLVHTDPAFAGVLHGSQAFCSS